MATPESHGFFSTDKRRASDYAPARWGGGVPDGLRTNKGPIYRVVRTVRTRRGFGTIIHTLTSFTSNRKVAHKMAARWVKIKTNDRRRK